MSSQKEFVAFILEGLTPLGAVTSKNMFGGAGIFRENLMFGLVIQGTLYFKVDDGLRDEYVRQDCEAFTYTRQGKPCQLYYFSAPEEALENQEELLFWARKSWQVAFNQHGLKSKKLTDTKTRH